MKSPNALWSFLSSYVIRRRPDEMNRAAREVSYARLQRAGSSTRQTLAPYSRGVLTQSGNPDEVEVISVKPRKPMGGACVLGNLRRELEIDKALLSAARSGESTTPVERAIFAVVADKVLCPSSKLALEE